MRVQRPLIALHARPSVRPSVRVRPSGRLLDRPRRSYPAKAISCSHTRRTQRRKPQRRHPNEPLRMQPFIPLSSPLCHKRSSVHFPLPFNFLSVLFLFLEWTMARSATWPLPAFIPQSSFASSASPSSAKRIYLSRKTNVTILLVRVPDSGRGKEREEGEFWRQQRRERVGGTLTSEIGDE